MTNSATIRNRNRILCPPQKWCPKLSVGILHRITHEYVKKSEEYYPSLLPRNHNRFGHFPYGGDFKLLVYGGFIKLEGSKQRILRNYSE